mgnify:FL=1|jgi:hypothetical protein
MDTLKILNTIAEEQFGEFGFSTCTEREQSIIVTTLIRNIKYRKL